MLGVSPETIAWYRYSLNDFYGFTMRAQGAAPRPAQLNKALVLDWLDDMRSRLKDVSVNTYFRAFRAYCHWLVDERYIKRSPVDGMRPPRFDRKLPDTYSIEDMREMLRLCRLSTWWGARDYALLTTVFHLGLRREEVSQLNAPDIRWEEQLLIVQRGKGGKGRVVYLDPHAASAMLRYQRYRDPEQEAYFQSNRGKRLTGSGIGQVFTDLAKRAGVTGKRLGPHTGRHTMATEYLRAGGEVRHLQSVLGHSSLKSTEVYTRNIGDRDGMRDHKRLKLYD